MTTNELKVKKRRHLKSYLKFRAGPETDGRSNMAAVLAVVVGTFLG